MRIRIAIVAATLLFPTVGTAQRRMPTIGGRQPGPQMPTGRQPEVIARAQRMVRSRYSVEAYPLIDRVQASGLRDGSPTTRWTSFGTGTRLDWRHTDHLSWTFDLTAAYLGGRATTETAELGMRIRPQSWNDRLHPFADLRIGIEHVSQSLSNEDIGFGPGSIRTSTMRYGSGFGAAAGGGVEYFVTNTLALTTGLSVMRSRMTAYNYTGLSAPTPESSFRLTTYRLAVGLRYNWVRYFNPSATTMP
jgi:hypothetical protein